MSDLKPGRELDASIAEKVMGWKVYEEGQDDDAPYPHLTYHHGHQGYEHLLWREPQTDGVDWNPSTDIAAAWEIVEKLKDDKDTFDFELTQDQGEYLEWAASFGGGKYVAEMNTAPLAICLAALKAVGT